MMTQALSCHFSHIGDLSSGADHPAAGRQAYNLAEDGDGHRMQLHEFKQLDRMKSASMGSVQMVKY